MQKSGGQPLVSFLATVDLAMVSGDFMVYVGI